MGNKFDVLSDWCLVTCGFCLRSVYSLCCERLIPCGESEALMNRNSARPTCRMFVRVPGALNRWAARERSFFLPTVKLQRFRSPLQGSAIPPGFSRPLSSSTLVGEILP